MNPLRMLILLAALTVATVPALAECSISGHVSATENADMPELGYWMYTLEVIWDTDSQTSLSHLDFVLDLPGSTCDCSDFEYALAFADIAGESNGTPDDCTVQYEAFLECFGDPSIPIDGILIKWEPLMNDEGCEPGPIGTGTFTFYLDLDPVEIDTDLPLLVEKNSGEFCEGGVTGVFPGLLCNPVGAEASSWSQIKGIYRQ